MKLLLTRYKSDGKGTLGKLYIEKDFECFILEDIYRDEKIKHITRISEGTYQLTLRVYGKFHTTYSKKYPEFHIGMIEVLNVPNFTDILIHPGNTPEDTSGCLLTGGEVDENKMIIKGGTSVPAYISLYKKISQKLNNDEKVLLTIEDNDREKDVKIRSFPYMFMEEKTDKTSVKKV